MHVEGLVQKLLRAPNRQQKANGWSCRSQHARRRLSKCLSNSSVNVYPIHTDNEEKCGSTHPCRNPTSTVNCYDLTPTRTQISEQEYSDLTVSNRTPYSSNTLNAFYDLSRSTKIFFSRLTHPCYQDYSKIFWRMKVWSAMLRAGRKPHCFFSFGSIISRHLFSRHLAYTFKGKLRRDAPAVGAFTPVSFFVFRMTATVCQSFGAFSERTMAMACSELWQQIVFVSFFQFNFCCTKITLLFA